MAVEAGIFGGSALAEIPVLTLGFEAKSTLPDR